MLNKQVVYFTFDAVSELAAFGQQLSAIFYLKGKRVWLNTHINTHM